MKTKYIFSLVLVFLFATEISFAQSNNETILDKIEKVALDGNLAAQLNMGVRYFKGVQVEKDYAKAIEWFTLAAENNSTTAQTYLGVLYLQPEHYSKDLASYWISKAMQNGSTQAEKLWSSNKLNKANLASDN